MATLSQAKAIGGIGSILIFIPFVSLVGWIMVVVAVKEVSDDLQDKTIFNNLLIAALTGIVGALAGGLVFVLGFLASGLTLATSSAVGIAGGLFLAWIFLVVSAVFLRRAYNSMGTELGVGAFKTTATLYLFGAALTIVVVGLLLLLIAEIVQAVAFFSIPERPPSQGAGAFPGAAGQPPPAAAPSPTEAAKFCTNCGTKISPTATFCYSCGAKQ
jgi:uncharacterized membrane protein